MAEDKLSRRLRTRNQEVALSETAIDASFQIAIPSNTIAVKRLWRTDDPKTPLYPQSLEFIIARQASGAQAHNYAWEGSTWRFDGSGSVAGILYRNIPALTSGNTTNWLLTKYPTVYLYQGLAEAATYLKAFAQAETYEQKANSIIAEIHAIERKDEFSGPLVMRTG